MSITTQRASKLVLKRGERIALRVVSVLAGGFLAAITSGIIISLRQKLVDNLYPFTFGIGADHTYEFDWSGTATVTWAGLTDLSVSVSDLQPMTVALIVVNHLLMWVVTASVAFAVMEICRRLLRDQPLFAPRVTIMVLVAGLALAIGGSAMEFLTQHIEHLVRFEITGGANDTPLSGGSGFQFSGMTLIAGAAITAVAYAFHRASELQHDTEGLV